MAVLSFLSSAWTKGIAATLIVAAIATSAAYIVNWYDNQLTSAYNDGQSDVIAEQNEIAIESYETQIKEEQVENKELQVKLNSSQQEIDKLKKQLLIDHDLNRLLQAKPGLIITRVNKGTAQVYQEMQNLTNE
jgi:hypothetical protein